MKHRQLLATALCVLAAAVNSGPSEAQQAAAPAAAAPIPQLTAEQWREDLRFMAAEMERRHARVNLRQQRIGVAQMHQRGREQLLGSPVVHVGHPLRPSDTPEPRICFTGVTGLVGQADLP